MLEYLKPEWPAPVNIKALTTLRGGGYSQMPYASANLAQHVGDDPAAVAANRALLNQLAVPRIAWLRQVHSIVCLAAESVVVAAEEPAADASFTREPRLACAVLTADCLPLLLCDNSGTVVAAAHAGWRGLSAGIIEATVKAMAVPSSRLMVWLGPAISALPFIVGEEVRANFLAVDSAAAAAFTAAPQLLGQANKWHCDLYQLAHLRLTRLGVDKIYGGSYCTYNQAERFYSYRRQACTGRMATLIWKEN